MSGKSTSYNSLFRRLMPLYVAVFFHGFVFFYSTEKLFMNSIGFDGAGVGAMVTVYSIIMLAAETPSGILADRWSRKGVLMLASLCLAASALIGGVSHNPATYFIAASFWGVFFAFYSGTYDSIVYDTVLEETGDVKLFDKLFGRVKIVDSVALVCGSLIGGIIAQVFSMRIVYFSTVPFALLAIVALAKFKEPKLHKSQIGVSIKEHLSLTFMAIGRNRSLLPVIGSLVCMSTIMYMVFEFSQVWYIALATPIAVFGPANAVLLSSTGLGGAAVNYLNLVKLRVTVAFLLLGLLGSFGLVLTRNVFFTIFFQVLLATILIAMVIIFNRLLHDALKSNVRAGAASAVSTLSRIIIIPLALGFGQISKFFSVFHAAWILVGLFMLGSYFILLVARRNNYTGLISQKPLR